MKVPKLQSSQRYLGEFKEPCLLGKARNSAIPELARQAKAEFKEDPFFKVYVRHGRLNRLSKWQASMLERLFTKGELRGGIIRAMGIYERNRKWAGYQTEDPEIKVGIKKNGILPYVVLEDVVLDETISQVILGLRSDFLINLAEHGITIWLEKGRWRFDYAEHWSDYHSAIGDSYARALLIPKTPRSKSPATRSSFYGRWIYNEALNIKRLRLSGCPTAEAVDLLKRIAGREVVLSNNKYVIKDREGVVSVDIEKWVISGSTAKVTVAIPTSNGKPFREVWPLELCDGRLVADVGSIYDRAPSA